MRFFSKASLIKSFELVFILGYTKILPAKFLNSNKLNIVIHESDLPDGKGFSPVQWQILEGKNIIPISLFAAVKKIDSGDIFERDIIKLNGYELFEEIRKKQAIATISLIKKFLSKYPNICGKKQSGTGSFYRKRCIRDDEIDINKTIKEQFNQFRIADNKKHPLYFVIGGNKYYIRISRAETGK
jgi:methionyl-tRNA formyltransferase